MTLCRGCFLPILAGGRDSLKVGPWRWHRECWDYARPRRSMVRWPEYGPGDPDGYYPRETQ